MAEKIYKSGLIVKKDFDVDNRDRTLFWSAVPIFVYVCLHLCFIKMSAIFTKLIGKEFLISHQQLLRSYMEYMHQSCHPPIEPGISSPGFMIAAPIPGSKCLDSPLTIPFYECGVQLTDMVYLQRKMIQ